MSWQDQFLTRQQQKVLVAVMSLLVLGWAVKAYRTAHPPPAALTSLPAQAP